MTTYHLEPNDNTLYGSFSREHPPLLTIASGDTIHYRTLDAGWGVEPRTTFEPSESRFRSSKPNQDGHCLIGPLAIRGAKAGMTLEIQIKAIRPGPYGYCFAGGWPHTVNTRLGLLNTGVLHQWTLDTDTMTARNQYGHTTQMRPFMGVMGMAPDAAGEHSTVPPRFCGGNIDCKELVAGTTLYLPIAVDDALFYVGDGHARQGDGEVSVTAIECPMDNVELTFVLHDSLSLAMPRAKTPEGWLTFGFHQNLEEALFLALEGMLDLLQERYAVTKADALALASVAVDMRVTQIVNDVQGVHAFLRDDAIWHTPTSP